MFTLGFHIPTQSILMNPTGLSALPGRRSLCPGTILTCTIAKFHLAFNFWGITGLVMQCSNPSSGDAEKSSFCEQPELLASTRLA